MDRQTIPILFFVVFGLIGANLLFRIVRNGGWKGAMFGAATRKLVGTMELASGWLTKTKLKVHVLDPRDRDRGPHVGVEVIRRTVASWQMSPIALTRAEARKLAEELSQAVRDSEVAS